MSETPAATGARFGHVNVIARDWRALATFYVPEGNLVELQSWSSADG